MGREGRIETQQVFKLGWGGGYGSMNWAVTPALWDQGDLEQRIPELNLEGRIGVRQVR